jgi:hypothetical protein
MARALSPVCAISPTPCRRSVTTPLNGLRRRRCSTISDRRRCSMVASRWLSLASTRLASATRISANESSRSWLAMNFSLTNSSRRSNFSFVASSRLSALLSCPSITARYRAPSSAARSAAVSSSTRIWPLRTSAPRSTWMTSMRASIGLRNSMRCIGSIRQA